MDVKQQRVEALERIREQRFNGNLAAMARAIGKSSSQLGQWFSGFRSISENSARKIERKLRLPDRFLDGKAESASTVALQPADEALALQISSSSPQLRDLIDLALTAEANATVPPRYFELKSQELRLMINQGSKQPGAGVHALLDAEQATKP